MSLTTLLSYPCVSAVACVTSFAALPPTVAPVTNPLVLVAANAGATTNANATALLRGPALEITKSCPKLRYIGRDATMEISGLCMEAFRSRAPGLRASAWREEID